MKKILITTTESLHGWEIESYLKPIFSNVVIGAGFLSDISAGFSDIFGGRSSSYEKKLQSVNDSALQLLQSKASEIGANCIIGLQVNTHQISGKNVQMFMVSAYGTGVIAKNVTMRKEVTSLKEIDKTSVEEKAALVELMQDFKLDSIKLKMNDFQRIIDNKAVEFAPYLIEKLRKQLAISNDFEMQTRQQIEKMFFDYFSVIDFDIAISAIYDLISKESDFKVINGLLPLIESHDMVDYNECIQLLQSDHIAKKKVGLKILEFNKPIYILEDVDLIVNVINTIKSSFADLSTSTVKKGFLSSNEKEVWICPCSKLNQLDNEYCFSCNNDKFGFNYDEIKPARVVKNLTNKIIAIKELLAMSN